MVNGYNILPEPGLAPRIFQMLRSLPTRVQGILFSTFVGLVNRMHEAEEAVESYMYETSSRSKWHSLGGDMSAIRQGVPGSDRLGLNLAQQIWVTFNESEDTRTAYDHQWEGFKLVASSNSPKGVRKIDERDTRLRKEEDDRRQSVMDRYFYYRAGAVDREGFVKNRDRDLVGSQVGGPKSVEQLETEMKRWVTGDHDEHDQIIENYKQRILDRQAQVEAEREERRRALAAESENRARQGFEPTPMIGYTQEQLARVLAERDGGVRQTARFVADDQFERAKSTVQRHVHRADTGNLAVKEGRIVDPQANPAADQRTLQQLIADRQVEYSDQPKAAPEQPRPRGQRPDHISESDWEEYGGNLNPAAFGGQTKGNE
tara:strand:+ start:12024 stop:13145 length:1122 start_codon:yes stop_codon:yes gene_type:complete